MYEHRDSAHKEEADIDMANKQIEERIQSAQMRRQRKLDGIKMRLKNEQARHDHITMLKIDEVKSWMNALTEGKSREKTDLKDDEEGASPFTARASVQPVSTSAAMIADGMRRPASAVHLFRP